MAFFNLTSYGPQNKLKAYKIENEEIENNNKKMENSNLKYEEMKNHHIRSSNGKL